MSETNDPKEEEQQHSASGPSIINAQTVIPQVVRNEIKLTSNETT